jgi:hypothetical protein
VVNKVVDLLDIWEVPRRKSSGVISSHFRTISDFRKNNIKVPKEAGSTDLPEAGNGKLGIGYHRWDKGEGSN